VADLHLEAWNSIEGATVVAVADESPLARERARSLGIEAFSSWDELLADPRSSGLRAASICTPTALHLAQATRAMSLGIPVLCEAPPAINPEETQRLLSGETSHRVPMQIAAKFRHLPEVRKAQYLVQNGILGTLLTFRVEFTSLMAVEGRWEGDGRAAGGGAWLHLGFHAVDLVRFLLSGITKIHGTQPRPRQNIATDDAAMLVAHTECGATGSILTSWSMPRQDDAPYLLLQGTEGRIEIGWKASFLQLNGEAPVEIGGGFSEMAAHKRMMRMFRDICAGAEDPWISAEEVMSAALTVEAGYRSMQAGRTIRVPTAASGLRTRLVSSL